MFDGKFKPEDLVGAYTNFGTIKYINYHNDTFTFEIYDEDEKETKELDCVKSLIFYIGEDEFDFFQYKQIILDIDADNFKAKNFDSLLFSLKRYIVKMKSEGYKNVVVEYEGISSTDHTTIAFALRRDGYKFLERLTQERDWTNDEGLKTTSYFRVYLT